MQKPRKSRQMSNKSVTKFQKGKTDKSAKNKNTTKMTKNTVKIHKKIHKN